MGNKLDNMTKEKVSRNEKNFRLYMQKYHPKGYVRYLELSKNDSKM